MKQVRKTEPWRCWYCRKPVGYVGRVIAWAVGVGHHRCDFSNVHTDEEEDPFYPSEVAEAWKSGHMQELRDVAERYVKQCLAEKELLIAKFILENPTIRMDQIQIVQEVRDTKMIVSVELKG